MNRITTRLAIVIVCALPAAAALADARIHFTSTEGGGASLQSIYVGQGKLRTDADAATSIILDPGAGTMTVLQHEERQYIHMGRAEIEQMSGALNAALAQMDSALANLPPEVRAQVQGMAGGALGGAAGAPTIQVVETGQRDTIAGNSCDIYRTQMQGKTISETCLGSTAALAGLSASDRRTVEQSLAMTQQLAERLAQGPLANMIDLGPFQAGLFPLRVTEIENGRRASSEFSGVDTSSLSADLFAVPAGYREQKIEIPRF